MTANQKKSSHLEASSCKRIHGEICYAIYETFIEMFVSLPRRKYDRILKAVGRREDLHFQISAPHSCAGRGMNSLNNKKKMMYIAELLSL